MIEILGLAVIANLITHWFEPIQGIKQGMVDKLPLWLGKPFICAKCAGLWLGLLITLDPLLAALTSLTSYLIENMIYFIDVKRNEL
jgi:hypothetical protein